MTKNHLKRIMTPNTWPIERKQTTFLTRPNPGPHPMEHSVPLNILLKDMLHVATTSRQARFILNTENVLVNGKRKRRPDASAGLFDVITFPSLKSSHRILINTLNKLYVIPIAGKDATLIPCKITSKTLLPKKKLQLGFHNGRSLLVAKDTYKMNSTIFLTIENKEESCFPLEKGAFVYITNGAHVGTTGTLEKIENDVAFVKTKDGDVETKKSCLFVLGKGKSEIKI